MKKIYTFALCMLVSFSLKGVHVSSLEVTNNYGIANLNQSSYITLRADVIEYHYRLNNGQMQYRRWNITRERWVDPYWIDV